MTYVILIEPAADGGYGAWAPDLPGCVAVAESVEQVTDQMRHAVRFHLAGLRADGEPVPAPRTLAATADGEPAGQHS